MAGLLARPRSSAVRGRRARGLYQRTEKRRGKRVIFHALWVPLHADNPVFMRFMLDGFDHAVRSDGCNAQAVAQIPDGLVM